MGERPNVHAEVLLAAAIRYGDLKLATEREIRAWTRDGPPLDVELRKAAREAEYALQSAARAYATRMRRKFKKTDVVI